MTPTQFPHIKYRPEIDGLRAIAVGSVIGYHAFPSLIKGGFIGVDVFFVISGFLISSIIFESLAQGRFSFADFYARRILRIFPALVLVLSFCIAFGWVALLGDEYKQLGKHITGGASFVSNFIFWDEAGYFDNAAETKPLLHLWSLGIEEQFYLVWPLVLWATYKARRSPLGVTLAVAALSFYLNIETARVDPAADFYAPQTRFWELMVGGVVSWLTYKQQNSLQVRLCTERVQSAASVFAAGLLVLGYCTINKHDVYPAAWAAIPVVASGTIIAAGPDAWLNRYVLSSRVLVWIGLISYPLYLWHWVLLSFARIVESGVPSLEIRIGAVCLSILLAYLTYKYIEQPIRRTSRIRSMVLLLTVLMTCIGASGFWVYNKDGITSRQAVQGVASLVNDLEFKRERMSGWRCGELNYEKSRCTYSADNPTVVVVGDSHAPHIYPGLAAHYARLNKGVAIFGGGGGCPPLLNVIVRDNKGKDRNCLERTTQSLIKIINDPSIDEVIFSSRESLYTTSTEFDDTDGSKHGRWQLSLENELPGYRTNAEVYGIALSNTLDALIKAGKKITYLYSVPELGFDIKSCIPPRPVSISNTVRRPCAINRELYDERNQAFKDQTRQIFSTRPSIKVVELSDALCDKRFCYGGKEGVLFYTDDNHLSQRGSFYIIESLHDKLN